MKIIADKSYHDRIAWLDILRGIGIILVLFGHICSIGQVDKFLYLFPNPVFFAAAGWVYKKYPILKNCKRRLRTVMVPYFFFGLCILTYWNLIERRFRSSDMTLMQSLIGLILGQYSLLDFNVHMWFLPCFFTTVVIYNIIRKYLSGKAACGLVAILSLTYIADVLPELPWGLDWVCKYILFYALGDFLAQRKADELVRKGKGYGAAVAVTGVTLVAALSPMAQVNRAVWFITGCLGLISCGIVAILLENVRGRSILQFFGNSSLVILCVHGPIYRVVVKLVSLMAHMNTEAVRENLLFVIVITFITLVLSSIGYLIIERWFPWAVGKKCGPRQRCKC